MQKSIKWTFSLIVTGVIIALALAGGRWQVSYGQDTTPTIPALSSLTPQWIRAGTTQAVKVTVTGSQFITGWGSGYTVVKLISAQGLVLETITPDYPTLTATNLEFMLPAKYLAQPGHFQVLIMNHPDDPAADEISEVMDIYVYVPLYLPILLQAK